MKTFLAVIASFAIFATAAAGEPCDGATQLFGKPLACADRATFGPAAQEAGATVTRVDPSYYCDQYGAQDLIDGADQFSACYMGDGKLATALYRIPAFVDPGKVSEVRSLVERKYGKPTRAEGKARLGKVRYEWRQPDDVTIVVERGWPDTTVYLEYRTASYPVYRDELARSRAAEEARAAQRQADAF